MLKDNLYTIEKITAGAGHIEAFVQLNAQHEIFTGHFPGQPVLPGVCMMQMIKEILETSVDKSLQLSKASDIKFLSVIQPTRFPLQFSIQYSSTEDGSTNVAAKITVNEIVCCKLKALFQTK